VLESIFPRAQLSRGPRALGKAADIQRRVWNLWKPPRNVEGGQKPPFPAAQAKTHPARPVLQQQEAATLLPPPHLNTRHRHADEKHISWDQTRSVPGWQTGSSPARLGFFSCLKHARPVSCHAPRGGQGCRQRVPHPPVSTLQRQGWWSSSGEQSFGVQSPKPPPLPRAYRGVHHLHFCIFKASNRTRPWL